MRLQLDQAVLPVVVEELGWAAVRGGLRGGTPQERYRSFWEDGQLSAERLARDYPVVSAALDVIADSTASSVALAVRRLAADLPALRAAMPALTGPAVGIALVGGDRHAGGGQVLRFELRDGGRVYYKPVPQGSSALFHDFLGLLGVPKEMRPSRPRMVEGSAHGWMQEVAFAPCATAAEVRRYWTRCGVLLAACCLLNFTDGHFENLIAAGEHPVLVDTETMLQNYSWRNPTGTLESVVDTGLVQPSDPRTPGRGSFSAYQVMGSDRLSTLTPFAVNRGSDAMEVGFRRITHSPPLNLPVLDGRFQTADCYLRELVKGFDTVFALCRARRAHVLAATEFWDRVAAHQGRQIIRETAYYARLLRLIQQPAAARSWPAADAELSRHLRVGTVSRYDRLVPGEMAALRDQDIPYFTHLASATHLKGGPATHTRFFRTSALAQVRRNIADRGPAFVAAQVAFLHDHLSTPPPDPSLTLTDQYLLRAQSAAHPGSHHHEPADDLP
ncbi:MULTISPECIES: DUF4135 domain-containing protein [unclassified Nonomuraea]|uniref:DUF4135 domain-containing protein n=1 Tax=unclassified Nonomuraea TaxID=2593643 RepID=UPI0033C77473